MDQGRKHSAVTLRIKRDVKPRLYYQTSKFVFVVNTTHGHQRPVLRIILINGTYGVRNVMNQARFLLGRGSGFGGVVPKAACT